MAAYRVNDGLSAVPYVTPTSDNGGKLTPLFERDGSKFLVFLPSTWTPADGGQSRHPVLLFLHGAGGVASEDNVRGQSLTKRLGNDTQFSSSFAFIVLIPILPTRGWGQAFETNMGLISLAETELGGDRARTYCAGQSMGGHGAMRQVASYPGRFAALVQVCGYLDGAEAGPTMDALKGTPVWAFHSADDAVVGVKHSDDLVQGLRERGNPNVEYTRYDTAPGIPRPDGTELKGHASFELAFATPELYPWLLRFSTKQMN